MDRDTFKMMALRYPLLAELRELRKTLAEMREIKLTVGRDGRNRTLLSPFQSKTGRNQPSTTRFIFGLPAWARSLIKPEPGTALAYFDFSFPRRLRSLHVFRVTMPSGKPTPLVIPTSSLRSMGVWRRSVPQRKATRRNAMPAR